jgi:Domain of unknown function (DUF4190)
MTRPVSPAAGFGVPSTVRTNRMAVWSLACALVGLFGCGVVLGPVAIALGRQARRDIRRTGDDGYGLAVAGIVVGWVAVGSWLVAVLVMAVAGFGP